MPTRPKPGPPWYTPPQQKADGLTVASESLWWTYIPAVGRATEYLYLDGRIVCGVTVDTTNFSGALSSADDTLQKALETLDAHPGVQGPAGEGLYLPGGYNVGAGYSLLSRIDVVEAKYNIAMGYEAGETITTGDRNVAIGYHAMYNGGGVSCTGISNVAIGSGAGASLVDGSGNICLGSTAGGSGGGDNNISIGNASMYQSQGNYNVVLGHSAGSTSLNGDNNIVLGHMAALGMSSGDYNIIIGEEAALGTTVTSAIAIGRYAGAWASYSIAIGERAETSAGYAIAIGEEAEASVGETVAIGYQAKATAFKAIQLGTGTNGTPNTLRVGAGDVISGTWNYYICYATSWVGYSDERGKDEIRPLAGGLDLIASLEPVTYKLKGWEGYSDWRCKPRMGLVAQQVKAAMDKRGGPHSVYTEDEGGWAVDYMQLIAPLVSAVQELAARLERLERKEKD